MKIVLNNVTKVKDGEFLTFIDGKKLLEMWKSKEITYLPEIQRGSIIKHSKNGDIESPVYSAANVKKIYNTMLTGNYYADMITLNVLEEEGNKVEFENYTLKIEANQINVSDGHHRLKALELLDKSHQIDETTITPEDIKFALKVTCLDIPKAQQQFYQFSQGLKISSSRAEYFNHTEMSNELVKKLMSDGNALNGKVEVVKNNIQKKDTKNLVTFATLVNAIEKTLIIENNSEFNKWFEFLNEYFNELFMLIPELSDYEIRTKSKEYSLVGENFMFYGYIVIAKLLIGNEDWKAKLPLILKLDLNKDSDIWFANVTKKLNNGGYGIINNNQSRQALINRVEKEFNKLM